MTTCLEIRPLEYNLLIKSSDGSRSYVIEEGAATDGATVDGFLAPPSFSFASVHLGDPLTIAGLVEKEACYAEYVNDKNDSILTLATFPTPGATFYTVTPPRTATLPKALQTQLGTASVSGYFICSLQEDDLLPTTYLPKHYLTSRPFTSAF